MEQQLTKSCLPNHKKEIEPKLAALSDEITQNASLFKRIESVYKATQVSPQTLKDELNSEQKRLVWHYFNWFVSRGARLSAEQKTTVAEINQKLASLSNLFAQNLLGDEEGDALVIEQKSDLAGLPQLLIEGAEAAAKERGMNGKWVFTNTRSSIEPFLTYSSNRALREKAFRMWSSRGDQNNSHNNNQIVQEILQLRQERSKIFGYPTYAHWHLNDTMAKTPDAAMDLMLKVWRPAVAQVSQDVAEMQALINQEGGGFKLQPWDYRYYAEKIRKLKYDLDFELVRPYLQLENIKKGMFTAAEKLYGFKFILEKEIPVFHEFVNVYRVVNSQGKTIGLWYFDPYARIGKVSGAWMTAYREQQRMDGKSIITLVSNNSNFIAAKSGEPVLISWDDATTLFHEFGHALHGLNSNVTYPSLSGTNTLRDFVEFPSQFNEHYLNTPEVLAFLIDKHGNPIPNELIKKINRANTFGQGFEQVEFLASGIIDMKLHLSNAEKTDALTFEKKTLQEIGMPSEIVMRHRIPQFAHIFSGEGYAAGYYGYLWAQVLEYDAFEAFTEAQGPYDSAVAKRIKEDLFSVGNSVDPAEAYRKFRGRNPKVSALLKARGFDH